MKFDLSKLVSVAVAGITFALGAPSPLRAQALDPILNRQQVEVLLRAHYLEEEKRLKVEIARRKENEILYLTGKRLSEVNKALGDKNQIPPIVPVAAPLPDPCKTPQTIFVRRNGLDTFQLGEGLAPISVADAKGASVSFTQDQLNNSNTVSLNGRVEAVMLRNDPLSSCVNGKIVNPWSSFDVNVPHLGYVIAPFVDAQGTTNNPQKKGETSALQGGVDLQFSILGGPLFDHQYLTLTPYYQTDFRGIGNVQGVKAFWEPIAPNIHLGGRIGVPGEYVDWFWQFRAEYDEKHITNPGITGLLNKNYQWIGSTAQAHLNLFPGREAIEPAWQPPFPALVDRIFVNGVVNYYWDVNTGLAIHLFEAELGYNITVDKNRLFPLSMIPEPIRTRFKP